MKRFSKTLSLLLAVCVLASMMTIPFTVNAATTTVKFLGDNAGGDGVYYKDYTVCGNDCTKNQYGHTHTLLNNEVQGTYLQLTFTGDYGNNSWGTGVRWYQQKLYTAGKYHNTDDVERWVSFDINVPSVNNELFIGFALGDSTYYNIMHTSGADLQLTVQSLFGGGYLTETDVNTWKHVNIPMSVFEAQAAAQGKTLESGTTLSFGTMRTYNESHNEAIGYTAPDYTILVDEVEILEVPKAKNIHTTETTATSATLAWDAVAGAVGYEVYRDGVKVSGDALITETTFTDNVGAEGEYNYVIKAFDANNYYSNSATFHAVIANIAAPAFTAASALGTSTINVEYSAATGATGYKIYVDGVLAETIDGGDAGSKAIEVAANKTYSVQMSALKGDIESDLSASQSVFVRYVDAPVVTGALSGTSLTLTWPAVSNAVVYKIYNNGVSVSSTPELSYNTTLTVGTAYTFTVVASDGPNDSLSSAPVGYCIDDPADNLSLAANINSGWKPSTLSADVENTTTGTGPMFNGKPSRYVNINPANAADYYKSYYKEINISAFDFDDDDMVLRFHIYVPAEYEGDNSPIAAIVKVKVPTHTCNGSESLNQDFYGGHNTFDFVAGQWNLVEMPLKDFFVKHWCNTSIDSFDATQVNGIGFVSAMDPTAAPLTCYISDFSLNGVYLKRTAQNMLAEDATVTYTKEGDVVKATAVCRANAQTNGTYNLPVMFTAFYNDNDELVKVVSGVTNVEADYNNGSTYKPCGSELKMYTESGEITGATKVRTFMFDQLKNLTPILVDSLTAISSL